MSAPAITRPESPPLRPELVDTPDETTATTDTPEQTTATSRPKRTYTKRARREPATGGTDQSEADVAPDGYKPTQMEAVAKQAHTALVNDLSGIYFTVGAILSGINPLAGSIVMDKAPDRARELVNACKRNPAAIKWLKRITKSSDVTAAVVGHGVEVVAILVAMDRLPLNQRYGSILHATGYDNVIVEKLKQLQEADNGAPVAA